MLSLINVISATVLVLNLLATAIFAGECNIGGKEDEEYDQKFSEYIQEIIENFRDQMPTGISEIGIPPIDPLVIKDITEDINDDIAEVALRMRNITIAGLSKFDLRVLKADLGKGFANFSIAVPEIKADGYCYMDGKIIRIFPINSDGPFCIYVKEVNIDGYGALNISTGEGLSVHMNDLRLSLTFGPLKIELKSLLGGGRWTQVLLKLVTGLGRNLFEYFNQEIMGELNRALLKLINQELDRGTLSDLIDLIPS